MYCYFDPEDTTKRQQRKNERVSRSTRATEKVIRDDHQMSIYRFRRHSSEEKGICVGAERKLSEDVYCEETDSAGECCVYLDEERRQVPLYRCFESKRWCVTGEKPERKYRGKRKTNKKLKTSEKKRRFRDGYSHGKTTGWYILAMTKDGVDDDDANDNGESSTDSTTNSDTDQEVCLSVIICRLFFFLLMKL